MNTHTIKQWLSVPVLLSLILAVMTGCSVDVADGGSEAGNANVIGYVTDSTGNPASNTQVRLLPVNYNLFTAGPFPDSLICTTDVSGRYSFYITQTGTFNILGRHLTNGKRLYIPGIDHGADTTFVPAEVLADPGVIKVFLPDTVNTSDGYLYIAGTTSGRRLSKSSSEGVELTLYIDSIPAGAFPGLYYNIDDGPDIPIPCCDSFSVHSNDTTIINAFTFWVHYTMANSGLMVDNIHDVYKDGAGTLWIGTEQGGAAKYDGQRWEVFTLGNSNIPANRVYEIIQDSDGLLWFATRQGAATFDGNTWYTYDPDSSGMPGYQTLIVDIDSKGNKWFGMYNDGLVKFDGNHWTVYDTANTNIPDDNIKHIGIDYNDHIWCASSKGGIKFDGNAWTSYNTSNSGILADNCFCVKIDMLGNIWFSHVNGVSKFDGVEWVTYDATDTPILGDVVYSICNDVHGNLWFGTAKGLTKFDDTQWTDCVGERYPLIKDDTITVVYIDDNDNKWLGTIDNGVIGFGPSVK